MRWCNPCSPTSKPMCDLSESFNILRLMTCSDNTTDSRLRDTPQGNEMDTYLMECVESMLKSRRLHETRAVVERGSAVRATFDGQLRRTCATTQTTNADHERRCKLQFIAVVAIDYRTTTYSTLSGPSQCSVIRCLPNPGSSRRCRSNGARQLKRPTLFCRICLWSADDWRLFTRQPYAFSPGYPCCRLTLSADTDAVTWHYKSRQLRHELAQLCTTV